MYGQKVYGIKKYDNRGNIEMYPIIYKYPMAALRYCANDLHFEYDTRDCLFDVDPENLTIGVYVKDENGMANSLVARFDVVEMPYITLQ